MSSRANKKINLVDFIFFKEGELAFWKWLPIKKSDAIKVTDGNVEFQVYVEPNYPGTFTFKSNLKGLSSGNHWVHALRVDVSFKVDVAVAKAINKMNPPSELIAKIAKSYRRLEDTLRDICRNDLGQWWLQHPKHDIEETDRDILGGMHVINSLGRSRQFLTGAAIRLNSHIPKEKLLITQKHWKKLETLIVRGYRTDLALVCLANAESLHHNQNYRIAMIEAVIALERAIFTFVRPSIPPQKLEKAEKYLKGDSVYDAAKNLLPLVAKNLNFNQKVIKDCCEAINKRNLIVHKTCFRLNPEEVKQYMCAINIVVRKLVPRQLP